MPLSVRDDEQMFYYIETWSISSTLNLVAASTLTFGPGPSLCQCYKTFFIVNDGGTRYARALVSTKLFSGWSSWGTTRCTTQLEKTCKELDALAYFAQWRWITALWHRHLVDGEDSEVVGRVWLEAENRLGGGHRVQIRNSLPSVRLVADILLSMLHNFFSSPLTMKPSKLARHISKVCYLWVRLKRLARNKRSSLIVSSVVTKKNKVL
jgi:hypothetical protein